MEKDGRGFPGELDLSIHPFTLSSSGLPAGYRQSTQRTMVGWHYRLGFNDMSSSKLREMA